MMLTTHNAIVQSLAMLEYTFFCPPPACLHFLPPATRCVSRGFEPGTNHTLVCSLGGDLSNQVFSLELKQKYTLPNP